MRLTFFIGKGGVGKTTVAASFAMWRATREPRRSALVISTDPAHSLGDVLRLKLGDEPTKVHKRLFAREIDAGAELKRFLSSNRDPILKLIEKGSIFTADEIGPLLDATLPGMAEIAGLLAIDRLLDSREFDEIIVDTAPLGHTLRLFEMPAHFARLLDFLRAASSRDELLAARFAGKRLAPDPLIDQWSSLVQRLSRSISGPESQIVLVSSTEPFSVAETLRASEWLRDEEGHDLPVATIVLNRSVAHRTGCTACDPRVEQLAHARRTLSKAFPGTKLLRGDDPGAPIFGAEQLASFGKHVFEERPLRITLAVPKNVKAPRFEKRVWPSADSEMSFLLGKGGVGKTTVSASLAFHTRQKQERAVTVASTDPAPSLDDVFEQEIGDEPRSVFGDNSLRAVEINAVEEYDRWAEEVRERVSGAFTGESAQGLHIDLSYDRRLIDALLDVVPPGVDEIFAILRISEILRRGEHLIIDMAPTGHALDLLRTPDRLLSWTRMLLKTLAANRTLPLARDAGVEVASIQHKVRELAGLMKDRSRSSVDVVMLPEPMPDRETGRLLKTLRGMDLAARHIYVNRVRMEPEEDCPRCARSRKWQWFTLGRLQQGLEAEILILPEYAGGVAGKRAMERFTQHLWRLTS